MKITPTRLLLPAAGILLTLTLAGCSWFRSASRPAGDLPSDWPESALSSASSPGTTDSAAAQSTPASGNDPASQAPSSLPENLQDESIPMPAHSEAPPTDDTAFNEVFSKNPIDAHYNQSGAASVQEMVEIATECASLWQLEVDSAYQKLLTVMDSSAKQALTSGQDGWLSAQAGELQRIQAKAGEEEGSNAALVAANLTMQYYRERAAQLYLKLYEYDKNFTYAYSGQ